MNKIALIKIAAQLVVGAGTTTISNNIIKNNVNPSNPFETISVAVASVVIGSMASEATKSHTNAKIDQLVAVFDKTDSPTEPTATA